MVDAKISQACSFLYRSYLAIIVIFCRQWGR